MAIKIENSVENIWYTKCIMLYNWSIGTGIGKLCNNSQYHIMISEKV